MKTILPILLLTIALVTPAGAQAVTDEPWEEPSYGLTLHPPRDARVMENTTDSARIKFIDPDYDVSLFIEETGLAMEIDAVKHAAAAKLAYPYPDMVKVVDEPARIAGRPGWKLYHTVPDEEHGDFVIGQAFIKIDPTHYAVLQFQCDNDDYDRIVAVFEQMLETASFADPAALAERRSRMLSATRQWKQRIGFDALVAALIPEQWFRIVEGDRDIGYARVTQREAEQLEMRGIRVEVRLRITEGALVLDQDRDYFLGEDGSTEVWSVRGTRRVPAPEQKLTEQVESRAVESWAETGLASDGFLTVDQQSDAGVDRDEWDLRVQGQQDDFTYLSQIETLLMPGLLPGDVGETYAFYAYYSNTHTLSMWTRRVEPLDNGAYAVIERPSPEVGQRRSTYDANGRLLRQETADGRVLLAVTREQIKRLHGIE